MFVLVACEESQEVCKAFRSRGHEAFSCDIQECSGGHPEWHIKGDVLPLLNGRCSFITEGNVFVTIPDKWDLILPLFLPAILPCKILVSHTKPQRPQVPYIQSLLSKYDSAEYMPC